MLANSRFGSVIAPAFFKKSTRLKEIDIFPGKWRDMFVRQEETLKDCNPLQQQDEQQKIFFRKKFEQTRYFFTALRLFLQKMHTKRFLKKKKKFKIKKFKRKVFIEENEPFETEEHTCKIPEYHFHRYLDATFDDEAAPQLLFAYPAFMQHKQRSSLSHSYPPVLQMHRRLR